MNSMISQLPKAPHRPGIYFFWRGRTPIYIGKAVDLGKRLASYGRRNARPTVLSLRTEATRVEWKETKTEVEALIQEAELIKKYHPRFNILLRDDKNYSYVEITPEEFPRIFVTHQPQEVQSVKRKSQKKTYYIGPFTSGASLKITLKLLRRIFPYCTCRRPHQRKCLAGQLGLCPGYCCSTEDPAASGGYTIEYEKNIKNIVSVLRGRKKKLILELRREMKKASRRHEFEKAALLRDQTAGIENIFEHHVSTENLHRPSNRNWNKISHNIQTLLETRRTISRAEAYDISNISGSNATGSMAVFINGFPARSLYRKFRIKTVHQPSDVDMHKEVIQRRLRHAEWPLPDLIVIDGGKPQLYAVQPYVPGQILLTALAKREEELYIKGRSLPIRLDSLPSDTAFFFQHIRDEAHRFARQYHHKLRELSLRR